MAVQDALTDGDKSEGYMLACRAKVQGNRIVEAYRKRTESRFSSETDDIA